MNWKLDNGFFIISILKIFYTSRNTPILITNCYYFWSTNSDNYFVFYTNECLKIYHSIRKSKMYVYFYEWWNKVSYIYIFLSAIPITCGIILVSQIPLINARNNSSPLIYRYINLHYWHVYTKLYFTLWKTNFQIPLVNYVNHLFILKNNYILLYNYYTNKKHVSHLMIIIIQSNDI